MSQSILKTLLLNSMKKYQELENKIAELQKEVERLKKQEKSLPDKFKRDVVLKILDNPYNEDSYYTMDQAFIWGSTPQGGDYWGKIYALNRELNQDDISQLQRWVIQSYRNEYGD